MVGSNQNEVTPKYINPLEFQQGNTSKILEEVLQSPRPYIQETNTETWEQYIPENTKHYLNAVLQEITPLFNTMQLLEVTKVLCKVFDKVECTKTQKKGDYKKENQFYIMEFIQQRTAEGCSPRTIEYYRTSLQKIEKFLDKHWSEVAQEDILKMFSYWLNKERPVSKTTIDNNRRILHTFYDWMHTKRYVIHNPVKGIKPTKVNYRVKKPFTTKDLEQMRISISGTRTELRDRAIFELLLSSGIRASELVSLNRDDVDYVQKEFLVIGKGDKERQCFFNEVTSVHLQRYIESRTDNNPALFVTEFHPYDRLGITGLETRIRNIGIRAGVTKAHPHRFRHTFATMALNRGIPIEQVQQLLGHEQLDTTLIYAKVAMEDVRYNHKKLMG